MRVVFAMSCLLFALAGLSGCRSALHAAQEQPGPKKSEPLPAAYARVFPGMPAAEVEETLGKPDQIYNGAWYYAEHRRPQVGENLPVYIIRMQYQKVVGKECVPGADATGPAPEVRPSGSK
jgi:outer membrane protein assembly factor BamE (lipoprotein component of BamABCDE complex)